MSSQVIRNYQIKELLGKGSYGVVYKVIKQGDKQFYVLKQVSLLGMDKAQIDEVKCEARILSSLTSPYIVKFYENFFDENNLNIIMEYCDGGDLSKYLQTNYSLGKFIKEEKIWKIFLQICVGIAYIHKKNILHRDLKTLNIFLTKEEKVRIGDLGVAKVLSATSAFATTFVGTPYYLSPEMCEEKPYNEKSDIWALGCILYEMATYKHPFNAKNPASLCIKILTAQYEPIHKDFSPDLKKIIEILLEKNYHKRPGIFEVLKNPVIKSRAKKYGFDLTIGDLNYNNLESNPKGVKSDEVIEKNEMKLKIVEEKIVKDKIEKKNGKEIDKIKKKIIIENPMKNIFMNKDNKQINNVVVSNVSNQVKNIVNNKLPKKKTPNANINVKYIKKNPIPLKTKEVVNIVNNNIGCANENNIKDFNKDQITKEKINSFESKLVQDNKKPATSDCNQKKHSSNEIKQPITQFIQQCDFDKYNLNKKILSDLDRPSVKLIEETPMKLPKESKKKKKNVDNSISEEVSFLKRVLPEKDFEKIVKENIPPQEVASIVKEKYLETFKRNPEKQELIKDNTEATKNDLFKELYGNLDNLIKIYKNSNGQNEENTGEINQNNNEVRENSNKNSSDKRSTKIGFNANIINAGNFKINPDELDENRIPLCLNNNTINFKLSKICYKENGEKSISSTENSQYEDDEMIDDEEEDEEEKESLKMYENPNANNKNNRYGDVILDDEDNKPEETDETNQEEILTVIKNDNDPLRKAQIVFEDLIKRKEDFNNKVNDLKKQCKHIIGEQKFNQIYQFYLNQCEKSKELDNADNDKINDYLFQEVSISNVEFMPHFCQIIYYELQLQYIDQELIKYKGKF